MRRGATPWAGDRMLFGASSALEPVAVDIVLEPERLPGPPAGVEARRIEVIQPSLDDEEDIVLDAAGRLVHRVSPRRGYLPRLVPGLRPSSPSRRP